MTTLHETARRLTGGGRGILAADESIKTMSARLEAEGIDGTAANRRDYRELLISPPGLADYVSGIILADETFNQSLADGRAFPEAAQEFGILPGIKVDTGTSALPGQGGATITEGLDGLGARLANYAAGGAAFAKWRAVIDPDTTTAYALSANAAALARYAALCQEHQIVPIVEPEVLANGHHDMARSAEVTKAALTAVFAELELAGVDLAGMVLKPNFVTPGLNALPVSVKSMAAVTFDVLRTVVPEQVPGIAFLSGGHSTAKSVELLSAVNANATVPWSLTFSFGRALVSAALATWGGNPDNVSAAQDVLLANCTSASGAVTSPQAA
ncbi:MAG: class I fructose-bisphosphate aldolase [Nostocoides sp.]